MLIPKIDGNGVYQGMVEAVPATPPDVGWYSPAGVLASVLGAPPTDEAGAWRDTGAAWAAVSADEARAAEEAAARTEAAVFLSARMHAQLAQTEPFSTAELAVLAKAGLFAAWEPGKEYAAGARFVHEGIVYETVQSVTAQAHQKPGGDGMLAVYRPLSVNPETGGEPDGGKDAPYVIFQGMDVHAGAYYVHNGVLYLAKADMTPCVWAPDTVGLWQWEAVD